MHVKCLSFGMDLKKNCGVSHEQMKLFGFRGREKSRISEPLPGAFVVGAALER